MTPPSSHLYEIVPHPAHRASLLLVFRAANRILFPSSQQGRGQTEADFLSMVGGGWKTFFFQLPTKATKTRSWPVQISIFHLPPQSRGTLHKKKDAKTSQCSPFHWVEQEHSVYLMLSLQAAKRRPEQASPPVHTGKVSGQNLILCPIQEPTQT